MDKIDFITEKYSQDEKKQDHCQAMTPRSKLLNSGQLEKQESVNPSKLKSLIPLVKHKKLPSEIVEEQFDNEEITNIATLLNKYHRSGQLWNEWRAKNWPYEYTDRWGRVIWECRMNGFINPIGENNKIVWSQVKTHKNIRDYADGCTMCAKKHEYCKGTVDAKHNFHPCWADESAGRCWADESAGRGWEAI